MARKGAKFRVSVRFPTMPQAALKLGVNAKGRVQNLVTDEVMKNLPDFMPKQSGELIASMEKTQPNRIRVTTPYARFLFFGKTRSGKNVQYSRDENPGAGPHWDRRMVAERGRAITEKVQRRI